MSQTPITASGLTSGVYALRGTLVDNATGPGQSGGILAIGATRGKRGMWTVLNAAGRTSQRSTDELVAAGLETATPQAPRGPLQSATSYVPLRNR